MKFAFIGGARAFGTGPGALAAAGMAPAAYCPAGAGGVEPEFPAGAERAKNAEELFAFEGPEFAAISLPPAESCAAIRLALGRGLHVFCEPPFCRTATEFAELQEAAEQAGRVLFPAQPWEHSPSCRALEKAVTRGLAGEVGLALCRLELPGPGPADWTASTEAWQALSLLLGAVRRPPAAVEARFSPGESAALHLHFGAGDGFLHLRAGAERPRLRLSVAGSAGGLELDGSVLRLEPRGLPPEDLNLSSGAEPGAARPEWVAAELSDFMEEISGGRPRGAGQRNARYCVKTLKNAAASAAMHSAAIPL